MDKPNRKVTWVHVVYERDGEASVFFSTERWKDSQYKGKKVRMYRIDRRSWVRMAQLVRVCRLSPNARYTYPDWSGWSVCFEWVYS